MLSPIRLRKNNIPEAARELELLEDKLATARTCERYALFSMMRDEIVDASRCYIRSRIRRSGGLQQRDSLRGVLFPSGILIRMTASEGMMDEECGSGYVELVVMGLAYRYDTGTPEIRLRCIHDGIETDCPFGILSGKGVARLLRVLSAVPLTHKEDRSETTYKYFTWK